MRPEPIDATTAREAGRADVTQVPLQAGWAATRISGPERPLSASRSRWLTVFDGLLCPFHRFGDHLLKDIGLSRADARRFWRE